MKFLAPVALLLTLVVAAPLAEPEATDAVDAAMEVKRGVQARGLATVEKRSITCKTMTANLRYHTKPSTSSTAVGEFGAKGTKVTLVCYVGGSNVKGDYLWWKDSAGYYVTDYYIDQACAGPYTKAC